MGCDYRPASTDSVEGKELALNTNASELRSAASCSSRPDIMNFTPAKIESRAVYPVKTPGKEEAKTSTRRSQKTAKKPSLGVSHSILQHAKEITNDVKASPILTLRVGDNAEMSSDGNFSTQDVPTKIGQNLSCGHNSLVQETTQSSSSLPQLDGRRLSSQTDAGGSSSLAHSLSSLNFVCNEARNQQISNKKHSYLTSGSVKVSSESAGNSQPPRHKRSSVKCSQSGNQIPLSENHKPQVADSGSHPVKVESVGVATPVKNANIKSQASSACVKRKAYEKSLSALSSHQKKTIPLPGRPPSVPHQQRPVSSQTFTAHLHIKWKGFEESPKTVGYKCFICKRDLSFTAECPVTQPALPPFVAVLPCGHTFHDQCLHNITPQDQLNSPPCIPCAVGEA